MTLMDRSIRRIVDLLDRIYQIMADHRVGAWEDRIYDLRSRLASAADSKNRPAVRALLEDISYLYGGMGSFNDLYISSQAGHQIEERHVRGVNTRFQQLQEKLYVAVSAQLDRFREFDE